MSDDMLSKLKHFLFDNPKNNSVKNANANVKAGRTDSSLDPNNLANGGDPLNWDPTKMAKQGMGPVYGPPMPSKVPGTSFNNPATSQSRDINSAMNILNNPYVTTPGAQGSASQTLQGYGLNAGPNFPKKNPYDQLAEQLLEQIQGIQAHATPLEQLQQMAQSQVNSTYDPVMEALKGEMGRSEDRAGRSQMDARNMYNALGDKMSSEVPQMQQMNQAAQDQTTQQYSSAEARMQQGYQNQANQQQALMDRLGISAATGDPRIQQTQADQQYFQNQNASDAQHQRDMLAQIGAVDQGFQQNMASNSRLAGENTAQDIGRQLTDYLAQANDKMTGLTQQKSSDYTNILNQLQQSDAQNTQTQANNAFQQLMAMNNFQLSAMNSGNQNSLAQQELALKLQELQNKASGNQMGTQSGMGGASTYLGQQYGADTDKASQLQNMLASVLSSPDVVLGKVKGKDAYGADTMYDLTNEGVMQRLREMAQQKGMQGMDINSLMDAYLAYKGQLR
jgi:hypothetical protein